MQSTNSNNKSDESAKTKNKYYEVKIAQYNTNTLPLGEVQLTDGKNGDFLTIKIQPKSEQEKSEGWKWAMPKNIKKKHLVPVNCNLAQVPDHLWNRFKNRYNKEGVHTHYQVKDGCFKYIISKTEHDSEIHELFQEVKSFNPDFSKIQILLNTLKSNKIYGWLTIRAERIVNKKTCWANISN